MKRFVALRVFALLTVFACLSCAGKRISDIDAPSPAPSTRNAGTWLVPDGVLTSRAEIGANEIAGLYPSTTPKDRRCCWLAPNATIVTRRPAAATTLHIDLLVPDYPFFEVTPQSLTIDIGGQSERLAHLAPGVHRLAVALGTRDGAEASGFLHVTFRSERAFVPAREHVNADTRALGIILLRVEAR